MFIEYIPSALRGKYSVLLTCFATLGSLWATGMAWSLLPTLGWRAHTASCALLSAATLTCRSATKESPRFLWEAGKHAEAVQVLQAVALTNGADLSSISDAIRDVPECSQPTHSLPIRTELRNWWSRINLLFTRDSKLQTVLLCAVWFFLALGFYSYSLWLPSILRAKGTPSERDKYMDLFLSGCAQLPGPVVVSMVVNRLGRRVVLALTLSACTATLWLFAVIESHSAWLPIVLLHNFFTASAWAVCYTVTPESFPTTMRSSGMGLCSMIARIAGMSAPLIAGTLLNDLGVEAALLFCGACYGVASFAGVFLPIETAGMELGVLDACESDTDQLTSNGVEKKTLENDHEKQEMCVLDTETCAKIELVDHAHSEVH